MPTFVEEYRTKDKTTWPKGPWDDEPDKVVWVDETTGLDCMIVRNHQGSLCGYVGVGKDHEYYNVDYDTIDVDVHGGLTFSDSCQTGSPEVVVRHIPQPGRSDDIWWLGFDCAHYGDKSPYVLKLYLDPDDESPYVLKLYSDYGIPDPEAMYRDLDYVIKECESLAAQLSSKTT